MSDRIQVYHPVSALINQSACASNPIKAIAASFVPDTIIAAIIWIIQLSNMRFIKFFITEQRIDCPFWKPLRVKNSCMLLLQRFRVSASPTLQGAIARSPIGGIRVCTQCTCTYLHLCAWIHNQLNNMHQMTQVQSCVIKRRRRTTGYRPQLCMYPQSCTMIQPASIQ